MNILQVEAITISCFLLQIIKHSYTLLDLENGGGGQYQASWGMIRYLGSQGLNTGQVWRPLGEDTPSYSMVQKRAGEFKRGRESLEDDPFQEDCTMPVLSFFSSIFEV